MWAQRTRKEKFGLGLIGAVGLVSAGVLGRGALGHEKTPIVFSTPSPTASASSLASPIASPASEPKEIVVDIEGAVKNPGIQHLTEGARVFEAIQAAGGKAIDADTSSLNLAAKVTDGSQVYLPSKTKNDAGKVAEAFAGGPVSANSYSNTPAPARGTSPRGGGGKHPSGPVSLNTGSKSQLESLPGVGPSTADKILQYRMEHGGFTSVNELLAVKGIGPKKLKAMKQWLTL